MLQHRIRHILIALLCLTAVAPIAAQTPDANLTKYQHYRERLRAKFIAVSENTMDFGVNIPASDLFYTRGYISWGDANNNMSHYLCMLATELYLLKQNQQDYRTTLSELYYAMLALERLDAYSEASLRYTLTQPRRIRSEAARRQVSEGDINGFALRNDVSDEFWSKYSSHFDVARPEANMTEQGGYSFEENSQDVIEHTIEGLALINQLLGNESVAGIPCHINSRAVKSYLYHKGISTCPDTLSLQPDSIHFQRWAQDMVVRYIRYMQSDKKHTYLKMFRKMPLLSTHWALRNPISGELVREGNGHEGGVSMISSGLVRVGRTITGQNLRQHRSLFSECQFRLAYSHPKTVMLGKEDRLARSVACTGNVSGRKTFNTLRRLRDTYCPYPGAQFPIQEHYPLMSLVLTSRTYAQSGLKEKEIASDRQMYEHLLNIAPPDGPSSQCGVREWTSTSRCLWPSTGRFPNERVEYNGLDYMMLYNLYCITFNIKGYHL